MRAEQKTCKRRASCQALPTGKELDHPAFQCIRNVQPEGQTVVTLSKLVTPCAMQQCLQFAYTGTVDRSALNLQETRQAAEFLELPQLLILLAKHPFVAPERTDDGYENFLKRRLQDVCLDQGLMADVVFELDDGACAAHKAMLTARCDVMKAMFSGDFRESQAKVVSFIDSTEKFSSEYRIIKLKKNCLDFPNLQHIEIRRHSFIPGLFPIILLKKYSPSHRFRILGLLGIICACER